MDFSLSSDLFNLVSIPLIIVTIKDVLPKWKSIWDDELSGEDRRLLLRMVMFLALPVVVLIHETGHLLAALQVGAKVYEFHYGPLTGFVKVSTDRSPEEMLWIALAGSLAQIILGFISLSLAAILRKPPLVAFLVYLGLFSIGDTVVFYAALSLASYYGDWQQIYTSPCQNLVFDIGLVHSVLIAFILYCVNGSAPRIWFTKKTNPSWSSSHKLCQEEALSEPSIVNFMRLANSFSEAGLYKEAKDWLKKADDMDKNNPGIAYAQAELEMAQGKIDNAVLLYEKLSSDRRLEDGLRAQIFLQLGEILLYRREFTKALAAFDSALELDPLLGDARLHRVMIKAGNGELDGLLAELEVLREGSLNWFYKKNQDSAQAEVAKIESQVRRKSS